jgi:diadenylate cyclase
MIGFPGRIPPATAWLSYTKDADLTPILGRWPEVSMISILDILLVAVLIYEFLVLIKGTRAAPMLVGVAGLALAFYVARVGELRTINWLMATLLPYAVFAMIVVFAAEIRHALAKLGRRLTFARLSQVEASESYDDIVLAADLFSQNQTGALVVIEREIGLRTYIESGVRLDAALSYDLLATLFRPSAPLHDGAVIVQKDRIAAAACFLPLSMNPVLSTQLGTRHRAGIGITEETDAISVIVSEETGSISVAVAGQIERDLSVEQLRQRLSELLRRYVPPATLPTPMPGEGAEAEPERGVIVRPARSQTPEVKP